MSYVLSPETRKKIGARVRAWRSRAGISSLDDFADRIGERVAKRPSIAKLSRIENGLQPVPLDILPALKEMTGIAASELRPDIAAFAVEMTAGEPQSEAAQ